MMVGYYQGLLLSCEEPIFTFLQQLALGRFSTTLNTRSIPKLNKRGSYAYYLTIDDRNTRLLTLALLASVISVGGIHRFFAETLS